MDKPLLPTEDASESSPYVNAIFAVLGFAYLFPYYAVVQPVDYWRLLFPNSNVEVVISLAYTITTVTTLLLLVCAGGVLRYTRRIVSGLAAQVLVLGALPAIALLAQLSARYLAVLFSTVVIAIATSFLDSSVFGLATLFPQGALEHVQLGIGLSGLFAAIFRVVSKACFPPSMVQTSTTVYFAAGAVVVAGAFIAYILLLRLPITRRCMHTTKQTAFEMRLLRKIWRNEVLVMLAYATSFIVFPGAISAIPSFQFPWLNDSAWWQLILLTVFAAMDVVGRYAAQYRCGLTARSVWRVVALRLLLVPLIICSTKAVWLTHDAISILLVVLMAFSNGYCGTLTVVQVNDCVNASELSATGMFSSLSINLGLVLGAAIGFGFSHLLHF
ncbi:hypothetical protein LEN26_003363 [Aphanomyces euteiches]|nr:hypothetical protein AeMF1_016158 [Aphanomyces euteiches]KAH9154778.1 hypothetical protein LEN26_003363 [Aphanomyces euteiches]KAH9186970.1 hypothetical protein AeNC1_011051 [Aphanomyces euteiches]